jgi:CheY-like chemotaxis protein
MNSVIDAKFENVMVIDDTLIDLYITARVISKNSFGKNLLEYSSATEALQYLRDNQNDPTKLPSVIFVDIYMPIMSGFEFIAEYDKLPASLKDGCKVFIISSSSDERDISRAVTDKNVVGFIEKPITKQFLESIVSGKNSYVVR